MRGNKTTITDTTKKIVSILKKYGVCDISFGIIIPIKNRRDHISTIKIKQESGAILIGITSKLYKQEIRIYDKTSLPSIKNILKEKLNESFRLLN